MTALTPFLEISTQGPLGVIALNRPEAINALNSEMIAGIAEALARWRKDALIRAVLFEGRGARGFCAGGDVRAMRSLALAGKYEEAGKFFAEEYAVNGMIATYDKPVVALTHGVVMGGGIGLAGHAGFRFTTADSRFAMPEGAIGFFSDVGSNFILAQSPRHRALAFLLSGQAVGAADAAILGLTDCVIPSEAMDRVRAGIVAAAGADNVETALVFLMQTEGVEPGEAGFCAQADALAGAFSADEAGAIIEALRVAPAGAELARLIGSRSPLSLAAILESHIAARGARSIAQVLAADLALARFMIGQPDFAEGVRAVLVDKDHAPRWAPGSGGETVRATLAKLVRAAFESTPD